jgi:hypothetical protein
MRSGVRFRPPRVDLSAELAWTLERAFGSSGTPSRHPRQNPVAAADLAEQIDLMARVASRVDRSQLFDELGEAAANRFSEAHRRVVANAMATVAACRQVAGIAAVRGAPVVATKGAALRLLEIGTLGARPSCDVDLMTSEDALDRLQRLLIEAGYREEAIPTAEQQLAPLHHPSGLVVELHRMLRGVRVDGRSSATTDALMERRLLVPVEGGPDNLYVPSRDVLLSHVLVHGIAQHGSSPGSYPLFRMVADVQDFELDVHAWQRFLERSRPWIGSDVSREEASAVWRLARRLGRRDTPESILSADDEPSLMLRHVIAGELDPEYQRSLRIRHLAHPLVGSSRTRTLLRKIRTNLWLRRQELDNIYGRPASSPIGYAGLRLWRPIDLGLQALASLRAGWRMRHRQK